VSASGAGAVTARLFQGRRTVSIILASAIGVVTPVCGVTILPLMTGLLRTGVPLAPIMAFWLASPVTDPGLFTATWAVLGPEFAIGKTFAGLALGLFAGFGTITLASTNMVQRPVRTSVCFGSMACGARAEPEFLLRIWDDPVRMRSFWGELAAMTKLVTICLGLAFAAEALLRDLIPPGVLASHIGRDSPYGILLATTIAAPLYVDGYAALPLIRGLLDLGMSPGAAMAFLVAGSAMSIWGILAVAPVLRASTAGLFVAFAVTGSLAIGYMFEACWEVLR
jgi:uncharacterized membrane protein YraQ (UPF0718 family)